MNKGQIILLEGTSNSGKTTLCEHLVNQKGFTLVKESIRYMESRTGLDQTDIMTIPTDLHQEFLNQELLFDVEFQKLFDANLYSSKGNNVIIDKSIFGILATAYAFEIEKGMAGGFKKSLQLLDEFQAKAKRFGLSMPDTIVFLSVNNDAFDNRNKNRSHILSGEWTDKRIIELQNKLLRAILPLSHIAFHEIDTTNKSKDEVAFNVEQIVCTMDSVNV